MFKSLKFKCLKVSLIISIILSFIFLSGKDEKLDFYRQLLENVKQTIQKIQNSKFKAEKTIDRTGRRVRKLKARKQIMRKLSNPLYRFKQQHAVIVIRSGQLPVPRGQNRSPNLPVSKSPNSDGDKTINTIKIFVKNIPQFNPFKIPSISDLLPKKTNNNEVSTDSDKKTDKMNEKNDDEYERLLPLMDKIAQWYKEVAYKTVRLWRILEELFVDDPQGAEIFKKLCPNLSNELFKDICDENKALYPVDSVDRCDLRKPNVILKSNRIESFNANNIFSLANIDASSYKIDEYMSLCDAIGVINKYGYIVNSEWYHIAVCLRSFILDKSKWTDAKAFYGCDDIRSKIIAIYPKIKRWFKKFEFVIKNKVIPLYTGYLIEQKSIRTDNNVNMNLDNILTFLMYKFAKQKLIYVGKIIKNVDDTNSMLRQFKCDELGYEKTVDKFIEDLKKIINIKLGQKLKEIVVERINTFIASIKKNPDSFPSLIDELLNLPDILKTVIKLPSFKNLINIPEQFQEDILKLDKYTGKGKYCNAYVMLQYFLFNDDINSIVQYPEVLEEYIGTNNFAVSFSYNSMDNLDSITDKIILIRQILMDIQILDYYLFFLYSRYKLARCLGYLSDSMFDEISNYKCVLEGGKLGCANSPYLKEIDKFFKSAGFDDVGLYNYDEVINRLNGTKTRQIKYIDGICVEIKSDSDICKQDASIAIDRKTRGTLGNKTIIEKITQILKNIKISPLKVEEEGCNNEVRIVPISPNPNDLCPGGNC